MLARLVASASSAVLVISLASACNDVKADAGTDADLTVLGDGAQFIRGPIPTPNGGPDVAAVTFNNTNVFVGTNEKPVTCTLAANATGAGFALADDVGYWILHAGAADVNTPGQPAVKTALSFSRTMALGSRPFLVFAVDQAGKVGAPNTTNSAAMATTGPRIRFMVRRPTRGAFSLHGTTGAC